MNNGNEKLPFTLYHMAYCPYCVAVRKAMDTMGLDIELRDISNNPDFRSQLVQGGGKPQVPCLKIEEADGKVNWLYESGDIIKYLRNYIK